MWTPRAGWFSFAVYHRRRRHTGDSDIPVYPGSLRYNAVSYAYLPLDAELVGVDPVRLPADGRVPIFRDGDVIVVAHEQISAVGSPA